MSASPHTKDEMLLVTGTLHMTDALEHAMLALTFCNPPEDDAERIQYFKHLMAMTRSVNAAKDTCGGLLGDAGKEVAREEMDR